MKAYILNGSEQFVLKDIEIPTLKEEEVLIKVSVCGMCHSEFYGWKTGSEKGKILGHEAVGIIVEKGERVEGFEIGDRVTGVIWEAFAEYTKASYHNIVKIPDSISNKQAILEPWACLMSGAERVPVHLGDVAVVVGTGFMGLGFMQLMQLKGVSKVIGVDTRNEALEMAEKFGATEVYHPEELPEKYILDRWENNIFEKGVPIVAEVTGEEKALQMASKIVGVHGTLAIVGYHHIGGARAIDMNLWNWKAFTAINAHERRYDYDIRYMKAMIQLIEAERIDTGKYITHAYGFEELNQAFADMGEKPNGYIKGYIRINGGE